MSTPTTLYAVLSPEGLDAPEMTLVGLFSSRERAHDLARGDYATRERWPLIRTEVRRLTGGAIQRYQRLRAASGGGVLSDLAEVRS